MKKIFIITVLCVMAIFSYGQGINYQTVVHDQNGIVKNKDVSVRFVIQSSALQYSEVHQVTTDEFGLINVVIGTQNPEGFKMMDWSDHNITLEVIMDFGDGPIDMGAQPFGVVPYAYSVLNLTTKDITNIREEDAKNGDVLVYDDGEWISSEISGADPQTLSLSGTTLSISGGNSVNLNEITTGGDGWGDQVANTSGWIGGNGTSDSPLVLAHNSAQEGDYLVYNGSNWGLSDYHGVEGIVPGSGMQTDEDSDHNVTVSALNENPLWNAKKLQGIEITTQAPNDGQILYYNNSENKWVNGDAASETGWIKEFINDPEYPYYINYTDLHTKIDNSLEVESYINCAGSINGNGISSYSNDHNTFAGKTTIGPGGGYASLAVTGGSDADVSDIASGVLSIGDVSGQHLLMDGNEIMAKSSGSSEGTLFLQVDGGSVRIGGNYYPSHIFQVSGVARSTQSTWDTSSDERVKKNIAPSPYGLSEILSLNAVKYDWKDEYKKENEGLHNGNIGFIAQEVEKVIPEMVTIHKEKYGDKEISDFRNISMDALFPTLVKAIQEQQKLIESLQNQINELKSNNEK